MNITEQDIANLNATTLLDRETLYSLTDVNPPEEAVRLQALAELRAKQLGIDDVFRKVMKSFLAEQKRYIKKWQFANAKRKQLIDLTLDGSGKPMNTIENFYKILSSDEHFKSLRFNQLSYSPEHTVDGKITPWTDSDDAAAKMYIEQVYKLRSKESYDEAIRVLMRNRAYHPIKQHIESIKWDGFPRIESFLRKWTLCEDTPYTREVSRLIFAGGINRLYEPGCKFDEMPILIGTRQGEGKSTLIRFLAMNDAWFTDVRQFEGQQGIEALEGAWICEVGELLALTKTKEQEAVKAFLSAQNDRYRMPFDRRVSDHLRQCIFIGTTNRSMFLTDRTGNRRMHPVRVNQIGYDLFNAENEVRDYIAQCWAEALDRYKRHDNIAPYLDRSLAQTAREEQELATEDDYRIGMVQAYLEDKDVVCIPELWEKALDNTINKPSKKDSNDLAVLMQNFPEWERTNKTYRRPFYGIQKCWIRKEKNNA